MLNIEDEEEKKAKENEYASLNKHRVIRPEAKSQRTCRSQARCADTVKRLEGPINHT